MTKQARIGLLVGLAFIIMFGLVLTELMRSGGPPQASQASDPQAQADKPADNGGEPGSRARRAHREEPRPLAATRRERETRPAATERPSRERTTPARARPERSRPAAHTRRARIQERQTYTVGPGDTLTSIARTEMGDDSRAAVRRLHEANADVVPDPNVLRVGQVLVIPGGEPAPRPATRATGTAPRRASPGGSTMDLSGRSRPQPRTYTVRSGDTLTRIARDQMNDGSRSAVRRLFEANRDVISDPDIVSPGMKLRIPD